MNIGGVCCKQQICADFEPATPTKEAIASLDCRFKRKVHLSTKEIKYLVRRSRIYERPPAILPKDERGSLEKVAAKWREKLSK